MLVHLISAENGEDSYKIYEDIRAELGNFDKSLLEKEEMIVISKIDTVSIDVLNSIKKQFNQKEFLLLSLYDDTLVQNFTKHLSQMLKNYSS
jgi:GTPase involved in cell partitioning and DNA repair